jgi:hypothetical protein
MQVKTDNVLKGSGARGNGRLAVRTNAEGTRGGESVVDVINADELNDISVTKSAVST